MKVFFQFVLQYCKFTSLPEPSSQKSVWGCCCLLQQVFVIAQEVKTVYREERGHILEVHGGSRIECTQCMHIEFAEFLVTCGHFLWVICSFLESVMSINTQS